MRKVLILFAHPRYEQSVAHKALVNGLQNFHTQQITFHDLYELYPDYDIQIQHEQELLLMHDVIVWQHPLYWYSCPPLLKQWIDMVLEYNWAYGPHGIYLKNKLVFNTITAGGGPQAYQHEGHNRFTLREFLVPFEQTARLCKMIYLPPFAVMGTNRLQTANLGDYARRYRMLLDGLVHNTLDIPALLDKQQLDEINTEKY